MNSNIFFNQTQNVSSNNEQQNENTYVSDYPNVFFTNQKYVENKQNNSSGFSCNKTNLPRFTPELMKQFIPMLFNNKKNSSNNQLFELLLKQFAPNMSNVFSSLKLDDNFTKVKITNNKESDKPSIIDLSDYNETN